MVDRHVDLIGRNLLPIHTSNIRSTTDKNTFFAIDGG
jgi:hypothetical protein